MVQVLLGFINNSVKHQLFVYTQVKKIKKSIFLTIQFSTSDFCIQFKCQIGDVLMV